MSSIQTIDELIVTGRIIFPDNTSQDTSSSKILSRCSNIVRDENLKTTSILNDDFVINKSCQIGNEMRVPLVKSKAIALMDDLDDEGNPQIQTQSFTTAIKSKIETLKNAVDELIPDVIDPPNKRARLSLGEFYSDPDYSLQIEGESLTMSSPYTTLQLTTLSSNSIIDSSGSLTIRSGYDDRLIIGDNGVINFSGGAYYDPLTGTFYANTFQGTVTDVKLTSDNSNGTFFVPFAKTSGTGSKKLFIDDVTAPLSYNPSNGVLTSSTFSGNATNAIAVNITSTSTNTNYPILFADASGTSKIVRLDNGATYNPSTNQLNISKLNGTATSVNVTSDNTNGNYFPVFIKSSGTGSKQLYVDDTSGPLTYNASTGLLSSLQMNSPIIGNTSGNLAINAKTVDGVITISGDSEIQFISPKINLQTPSVTGNLHAVQVKANQNSLEITRYLKLNHPDFGPIYVPFLTEDPSVIV